MKHVDELLRTCRGIRKIPRKAFDMSIFGNKLDCPKKITAECGFRGCFIGWHRFFNKKTKLVYIPIGEVPMSDGVILVTCNNNNYGYGECWHTAVARYFGISSVDAEDLFLPTGVSRLDTPKQVARRVENFIKRRLREEKKK